MGDGREDDDDRARPDAGQSASGRTRLRRGSARPQRHRRRFPGPASVDRPFPERRFHGGDPEFVVRLERHPPADDLRHGERLPQRRVHVDGLPAHEHRADFRRRAHLLESRGGQTRHRLQALRRLRERPAAPHQFRRGHPRRHRPAEPQRQAGDEAVLGNHQSRSGKMSQGDLVARGDLRVFPRRRFFLAVTSRAAACR